MTDTTDSTDADITRGLPPSSSARGVWLGLLAFVAALAGTQLLNLVAFRIWAVLLLLIAGVLAILAWHREPWTPVFPANCGTSAHFQTGMRRSVLALLAGGLFLSALSHVAFLSSPHRTFGAAGVLWLAGIALLITAAAIWPGAEQDFREDSHVPAWDWLEAGVVAAIAITAVVLRVWNLRDVPFNIYPDEIMTGLIAEQAYLTGANRASVFSTLWGDVELPALWFAVVAGALKLGGIKLAVVRLPAALFGAATVLPFYGLVRCVWGRAAAITGASIIAFSAANVHYSRMALNNITTPFFWAACFFFIVRGLQSCQPLNWTLAGLAAGLSEHFYYGTRLLPFILITFVAYLFIVHWSKARRYLQNVIWLAVGYFMGFGPLLSYFLTHHGLYYGRGAGLMTWNRIPVSWNDFQQMWKTLWPIMSDNLLGISTYSAQDIMYYAPLLLGAEAALLVLGVALLVWRWRHPAAFLVLLSGVAVLFVGGTLVLYPNSSPPMLAHWTPAFPAFYTAIAVPVGAWVASARALPQRIPRWVTTCSVAAALLILAYANIRFYFFTYSADPETLRTERYKAAQRLYEVQTMESRYTASLGSAYRVVVVGKSPYPYDPETTRYLVHGQEYIPAYDPNTELLLNAMPGKGLAFLFFPGSEQYSDTIRERYPGGTTGEVHSKIGHHAFYTYVVRPGIVGE